jgi:integrase
MTDAASIDGHHPAAANGHGGEVAAMTLNAYLDEWLALSRSRVKPSTWQSYDDACRAYLRPALGGCRVGELTVHQLNLHFVQLLQEGGRRGGPLSQKTLTNTHAILHKALADAVTDGRLDHNIASRVRLPRHDPDGDLRPSRLRTWDTDQAARFLELTAGDPLHDLWRVALATGMRRGELLGLSWEDVDLEQRQVRVRRSLSYIGRRFHITSTKTGRTRVLAIDDDTVAAIARRPRPTHPDWPLVFTGESGMPIRPQHVTHRWRAQWPDLELPRITFHALRHCHACLLLDQGVPIPVVSQRLGHTNVMMTMRVYAHVLPAQDHAAAAAIGRALAGP